jgi:two-component system, cell cycle response regulator DivK
MLYPSSCVKEGKIMTTKPKEAYVLVIEDNPDNQQIIKELLEMADVGHITVRSSGWQGLRAARETLPRVDLILLDIQLPAEDGFAVLRRIRETPRFSATRVVAVTADMDPQAKTRARTAGFDGFISKPLDFRRFPGQIQALLRGEEVWYSGK